MLRALYEYGRAHPEIILPDGYALARVDYIINVGSGGSLLGIEKSGDLIVRPYFTITRKPVTEPFAEKAFLSVGMMPTKSDVVDLDVKRCSFLGYLDEGRSVNPALGVIYDILSDDVRLGAIQRLLDNSGCGPDDIVGFRYDGKLLHELDGVADWWQDKYVRDIQVLSSHDMLDVVTGEVCRPALISGSGLKPPYLPDAKPSGSMLVTFNAAAFESYGLSKNENAAMSHRTVSFTMNALRFLCERATRQKQRIGGIRFVHWYSGHQDEPEDDLMPGCVFESVSDDADESVVESMASRLVRSPLEGVVPSRLDGYEYHILLISAQGARISVLSYSRGDYRELYEQLKKWADDFSLTAADGVSLLPYKSVNGLMWHLLSVSEQKSTKGKFDGLKSQYPRIMQACLDGGVLPVSVLSRALSRFFSDMVRKDGNGRFAGCTNYRAASWIKSYLVRIAEQRKEESNLMSYLNEDHPNPAYHCGRVMAVYAEMQASSKSVNVGVTERFYNACMRSPALVLGQLQGMANHWLDDMKYFNKKRILEEALHSAYGALDTVIPKNLSMEDRGYFTLGFVQQQAALNKSFAKLALKDNKRKEEDENE